MVGTRRSARLGLLVNPIAGMGGRVALKGTDGPEALRLARSRGATPTSPERARRALARLAQEAPRLDVVAAPGGMGEDLARACGLPVRTTGPQREGDTGPEDTRAAAATMRAGAVDLLLFAGGDGTARDILDAVGADVPVVGVPTGVKMHSGVFASTPAAAGAAAAAYLRAPDPAALRDAEVADVDEDAVRHDRIASRLYGAMRVPRQPGLMVSRKAAPDRSDAALEALAAEIARTLPDDRVTLIGPGTTTAAVLRHLGIEGTLLGVDAVRGDRLVGRDLDERALLALLDGAGDAALLVGVVGGQGALFGRGNQQLSPAVLRRIGRDRIQILAGADKLMRLDPPRLRVDTGDEALDAELSGYVRVRSAPGRTTVMKVST